MEIFTNSLFFNSDRSSTEYFKEMIRNSQSAWRHISTVQLNSDTAQCDQSDPDHQTFTDFSGRILTCWTHFKSTDRHFPASCVEETLEEKKLLISSSSVLVCVCVCVCNSCVLMCNLDVTVLSNRCKFDACVYLWIQFRGMWLMVFVSMQ